MKKQDSMLELLKELNVPGDTFFIELAYKIMGDIEISEEELVEKILKNLKILLQFYYLIYKLLKYRQHLKILKKLL